MTQEAHSNPALTPTDTQARTFSYGAAGLLTSETHPEKSTSYSNLTSRGKPRRRDEGGSALFITYYRNRTVAGVVHGNNVTDHQGLDGYSMARPARLWTTGASRNWDSGLFAFNGAGNVNAIGSQQSFLYDPVSQLKSATLTIPTGGPPTSVRGRPRERHARRLAQSRDHHFLDADLLLRRLRESAGDGDRRQPARVPHELGDQPARLGAGPDDCL